MNIEKTEMAQQDIFGKMKNILITIRIHKTFQNQGKILWKQCKQNSKPDQVYLSDDHFGFTVVIEIMFVYILGLLTYFSCNNTFVNFDTSIFAIPHFYKQIFVENRLKTTYLFPLSSAGPPPPV